MVTKVEQPENCPITGAGHNWGTLQQFEKYISRGQCDCGAVKFFPNDLSDIGLQRAVLLNEKKGKKEKVPKYPQESAEASPPVPPTHVRRSSPRSFEDKLVELTPQKDAIIADVARLGVSEAREKYGVDWRTWIQLRKHWSIITKRSPRGLGEKSTYYDEHTQEILADYEKMTVRELEEKWHMPRNGWYYLKRRFKARSIVIPTGFANRLSVQPKKATKVLAAKDEKEKRTIETPFDHLSENDKIKLVNSFTIRELEILELMAAGWANQEVANRLFIDIKTIEHHNNAVFSKVKSRLLIKDSARVNLRVTTVKMFDMMRVYLGIRVHEAALTRLDDIELRLTKLEVKVKEEDEVPRM